VRLPARPAADTQFRPAVVGDKARTGIEALTTPAEGRLSEEVDVSENGGGEMSLEVAYADGAVWVHRLLAGPDGSDG
jgi:hypothetical protein